jgi:hypothetical protein
MYQKKRFYHSPRFKLGAITAIPALVCLIAFRPEIGQIWALLISAYRIQVLNADIVLPLDSLTFRAFGLLIAQFIVIAIGFSLAVLLISQFVLPVHKPHERQTIFERLFMYCFGMHGPAIFIKEGMEIANPQELDNPQPGVVLVDLNSAVVLEAHSGRRSIENGNRKNRVTIGDLLSGQKIKGGIQVHGPGIVFTNYNEKIRGSVDLRPQARVRPDVRGQTRDGIEVSTNILVIFTLGQAPDVLEVGYEGLVAAENLRVIRFKEIIESRGSQNGKNSRKIIKEFSDELDPDDKDEIHRTVRDFLSGRRQTVTEPEEYTPPSGQPFEFEPERVFAAVFSRAKNVLKDAYMDWTELPVHTGAEIFRNMLIHETYEYLYQPEHEKEYNLKALKTNFASRVRNQGLLSFQFIGWKNGEPLKARQEYDPNQMITLPVLPLRQPKVLRSRGVKVIYATFTGLKPVNSEVYDTLMDNWRAGWEKEATITKANYDLQAMRIRMHARAHAQRDMIYKLNNIMRSPKFTEEALALRIFQALETAATEPATRKLLPADTINLLRTMRHWFIPEDDGDNPPPPYRSLSSENNNILDNSTLKDTDDQDTG